MNLLTKILGRDTEHAVFLKFTGMIRAGNTYKTFIVKLHPSHVVSIISCMPTFEENQVLRSYWIENGPLYRVTDILNREWIVVDEHSRTMMEEI
jgi:hypothetical protein